MSRYRLADDAVRDLADIVAYLRVEAGEAVALDVFDRLRIRFEKIAAGIAIGHRRADVTTSLPLLFTVERPYVIAFDPETLTILRVVHGARDFRRLFPEQPARR